MPIDVAVLLRTFLDYLSNSIKSRLAPTKLVALSDTIWLGEPRLEMNRLNAATIAAEANQETASK